MSLSCILRGIPKTLQVSSRQFLNSGQLLKCSAVVTNIHLQQSCFQLSTSSQNFLGNQFSAPVSKKNVDLYSVNFNQLKSFSVSPKRQSGSSGDHSKLWGAERILAISLLGILPAAFIVPSQIMDVILSVALVMHNHWGIEAVVVDYVRPIIFGPLIPKIAHGAVYGLSIITLVGLFYLIFNDCGLVNTIQMLWKL